MTKDEVAIGRTYLAKVTDRVVPVRIDAEHPRQGWFGTNQVTNKRVLIKSAQRLRREVGRDDAADAGPDDQREVAVTPATPPTLPATVTEIELVDEPAPTAAPSTPSYDERLMFFGDTDPAAARAALANSLTGGTEEDDMSRTKKNATKKPAAKAAGKKASGKKASGKKAKPDQGGKMSALDAAAKVLAEAAEPMTTGAMIEAMAKKGYWTSPGGKTPSATLYSAILREINTKGADSRFTKTERGQFAIKA